MMSPVSDASSTPDHRFRAPVPSARRVLLTGAGLGLVAGALLSNLATAVIEFDESRTLGATCEHAEATITGAPAGLLVGLAAAVCYFLLRRQQRPIALALLGGLIGGVVALLLADFLLYPLATYHLPIFVCPY